MKIIPGRVNLITNLYLSILISKDKEKLERFTMNLTMDNLKKTNFMVKVHTLGIMERFLQEIGFKDKCMGLVNFAGRMELFIEDYINMTKGTEKEK